MFRQGEVTYGMPAIETFYRGTFFRSRLEARYAALFDLCRWSWVYEPCDFNGWFPDFALIGEQGNRVFVEVKPITESSEALQRRIDASECPDEVLIVGLSPTLLSGPFSYSCRLGWLREGEPGRWWWEEAPMFLPTPSSYDRQCDKDIAAKYSADFCHSMGSYKLRMSGLYDGDHFLGELPRIDVEAMWGRAHEMVRYNPS